jgi:hypothetical protein
MKAAAGNTNPDGVIVISEEDGKKHDRVEPVPSDDVASKFSDLSESSTDHNDGKSENRNSRQLRSTRSEDYENFEKMLRNKHSKACKAMSVRSEQTKTAAVARKSILTIFIVSITDGSLSQSSDRL